MANYNTLQEAINAGTTNMTSLYSGSTTWGDWYGLSIDWFNFNNARVYYFYNHGGCSYVAFAPDSSYSVEPNIGINYDSYTYANRCTNRYRETGTINGVNFCKLRFAGYSSEWDTSESCRYEYEIFLFNLSNQIYIRYIRKPESNKRMSQFVCGSQTVNLSDSTYSEWTLIPNNIEAGKDWVVKFGSKPVLKKLEGEKEFGVTFTSQDKEALVWEENIPTGTTIDVYAKYLLHSDYQKINSGFILDKTKSGQQYTLWIKIRMTAGEDALASPTISNLHILTGPDRKKIYLNMASTISNTAEVAYDGLGGLQGFGGPVAAFNEQTT